MKPVVLIYRFSPQMREQNPQSHLSFWQSIVVSEVNSRYTDGDYDLVRFYRDTPLMWEVQTYEING